MRCGKRRSVGNVVAVPLCGARFGFALVLDEPLVAFFDLVSQNKPPVAEIVRHPVLFRIRVTNYAVTKGIWPVLGHAEVPSELRASPSFFKQDPINHQPQRHAQWCRRDPCGPGDLREAGVRRRVGPGARRLPPRRSLRRSPEEVGGVAATAFT